MKKHPKNSAQRNFTLICSLCVFVILVIILLLFSAGTLIMQNTPFSEYVDNTSALPFIFCAIAAFAVGSSVTPLILRIPLGPVYRLITSMRRLASGHFEERVDLGETTLGRELTDSFNTLASELQNTELLRTDFINNFSHEFKTPIVSIRGFAHQLRYEDLPPEKREEYLEIICKESDRLAHMASRILLLSKYENLSIVTEKTSYDLDEQIRHCILLLEKQWDEKGLELDIELDTVRCYSNEEMLSQLWVNLLGNAVKFTPHGGTVGVSLRQEGEMAIVKVTDTGNGIPDDVRAHIFDKFYQGDTSHKSEGNGIGLTLVHRIVELCNGTIEVESTVGEGSTFTVRLPVAETVAELEQTLNERSRKESTHEPDGQL